MFYFVFQLRLLYRDNAVLPPGRPTVLVFSETLVFRFF
ncbi:hypothetical protein LEP1GSC115_0905 [Leptospira interrogans serovar Australis str. 200703203]|uniref:Uncharacterized protein n=1 Tax=Leptospira interrogans serovar Australis str. 200703203 TaxID=1085541 RepID=N1UBI9_LEPIR|nr:hypothetical protein LEP1GSC115_0905 [Leptospira interrogans serovar Australis str. 200703203]